MAEGDTIHRLAHRLGAALSGQEVGAAHAPAARSPLRLMPGRLEQLRGSEITSVEARGKHLLIGFGSGLTLHSHLGMKGSWQLDRPDPAGGRSLDSAWLVIETTGGVRAVQLGGPHLSLLDATELRHERRLAALGPDVLADSFDPHAAAERMLQMAAGSQVGEALLDQGVLAGIGNVLKSEGCFAAKVDPFAAVGSLAIDELRRLLALERELMIESVRSGRRRQRIYRRSGRPCPRCGTPIRAAAQGASVRRTYWCPRCQRARRER